MADRLIRELTELAYGSVDDGDWFEVQEADNLTTTKRVTNQSLLKPEADIRETNDDAIILGVALQADGSYDQPVGTNYLDATTDVMDALETLDSQIANQALTTKCVSLTNGEIKDLFATPYTLFTAPGANELYEIISIALFIDYTAPAFGWAVGGADRDLEIYYNDGVGDVTFMVWDNGIFTAVSGDEVHKGSWVGGVTEMYINTAIKVRWGQESPNTGGSTFKFMITYVNWDTTECAK